MKVNRPIARTVEDVAGMVWSEKIDGFRCLWTGSQFVARSGNTFDVPADWLAAMPSTPCDGELFAGSWSQTSSAIKSGNWAVVRFYIFDAQVAGKLHNRLASIGKLPAFCSMLNHAPVFGEDHLRIILESVVAEGGEGIVLRDPESKYHETWLKVKPVADTEGTVIEPYFASYNTIPAGYVLQVGPRTVRAQSSKEFNAGDVVTFRYRGDMQGARIKGVRQLD